jgi:hypothetical protein
MTTPNPTDPQEEENPGMKMRSILSSTADESGAPPAPRPLKELPRKPAPTAGSRPPQKKPQMQTKAGGDRQVRIPFRRDKVAPAFWTVSSLLSITVNVVMLIVVIALVRELAAVRTIQVKVVDEVLGGLHRNFVEMDMAHIVTTIDVSAEVPVVFDLPVVTNTTVVLTEDVQITGARVTLNTGGLNILSAPTNIILPAGTSLPIALNITVPVQTSIPISLTVPVDIPLANTDLHKPFVGLKDVIKPYHCMLDPQATLLLDDGTVIDLCTETPAQ